MFMIRFLDEPPRPRAARDAHPVIDEPLLPAGAVREGLTSGLLAAGGVALWFLLTDTVTRAPFATPRLLGTIVANALGLTAVAHSPAAAVVFYSIVHVGTFALLGLALITCIVLAQREPHVLAGALIAFVIAEMAFYFLLAAVGVLTPTGPLTLGQVALGNLIGVAIMGLALWRWHPELGPELHRALAERD